MCEDFLNFQRISDSTKNTKVKKIFNTLAAGEMKLCNSSRPAQNQAILIVGNTNPDRNSFFRWIAGNDSIFQLMPDKSRLGEYTISDGNIRTDEFSPVPVCISDPQAGALYCDFPAFEVHTHRDITYDIAATHFMKKVTKNVTNIKICFLIEHYKMTYSMGNQDDLLNLLKHVTALLPDTNKVKSSVLLVVTKIPSKYSSTPDNQIVDTIVHFMGQVTQALVSKNKQSDAENLKITEYLDQLVLNNDSVNSEVTHFVHQVNQTLIRQNEQNELENTKMIELLELLMFQKQNEYPRIALFRSPSRENKANVVEKLNRLDFARATSDVFVPAISETSFNFIATILSEIRDSVVDDVKTNGKKIQQYFAAKEAMIKDGIFEMDLLNVCHQMESGYEKILAIKTYASKSVDPKECLSKIIKGVSDEIDNSANFDLSSAVDSTNAFEFLYQITGNRLTEFTWCVDGLAEVIQYLDDSKKWYNFAKILYKRLLDWRINKNMVTYNITNEDMNKKVSETDLKVFLLENLQEDQLFVQYESVKDVVLTEFKFKSVRQIAHQLTIGYHKMQQQYHGTQQFLSEWYDLENRFYSSLDRSLLLSYYQLLYARVVEYIEKRVTDNTTLYLRDAATLDLLRVTILSRIRNIDDSIDNLLMVDLEENFNKVFRQLSLYNVPFQNIVIDTCLDLYRDTSNIQIIETYAEQESIVREIDRIHSMIDDEIAQVIRNGEPIKQQNNLTSLLELKALTGMLKVTCIASSFHGPMGAVASAARGLLEGTYRGYLNEGESSGQSMIQGVEKFSNFMKEAYPLERRNLRENLLIIDRIEASPEIMKLITTDKGYKNVKNLVDNLIKLIDHSSLAENIYWREKKHVNEVVDQYYQHSLQEKVNDKQAEKEKKTLIRKWVERVKTAIKVAESGISNKQSKDLISKVGDNIQQVESKIGMLKKFEHNIRMHLMPEIDIIRANMTSLLQKRTRQPLATFVRNKGMLQNLLEYFKRNINNLTQILTQCLPIQQNITASVGKLLEGMHASVQIYNRIQDFEHLVTLYRYFVALDPMKREDDDPRWSHDLDLLERQIKANLILQEYKTALGAYKQYMFPVINNFSDRFNITPFLKPRDTNDSFNTAIWKMIVLRNDLNLLSSSINALPDIVFANVRFDFNNIERKHFFIWRSHIHRGIISRLMQGREVMFKADIREIRDPIIWVKFKDIGIRFLSSDKELETTLRDLMNPFNVKMTHMGDSHYRCDNEYYVFYHNMMTLSHAMTTEMDWENNPFYLYRDTGNVDATYTTTVRISNHQRIFSPYANWKIQLISQEPALARNHFEALRRFLHRQIDVALEGHAQLIQSSAHLCTSELKKYYKLAETSSYNHYHYDSNAPFETNSANAIKSPINIVTNWLFSTLEYFKPLWLFNGMYYDLFKCSFRSIFVYRKLSDTCPADEDYVGATVTKAKFNVYSSLILADFLVRWLIKVKPHKNVVKESTNSIEITAFTLNLVEQVENLIQLHLPNELVQFDVLTLITRLEKKLKNDPNATAICNVINQTIAVANSNLDRSPFIDRIRQKVTEMMSDLR